MRLLSILGVLILVACSPASAAAPTPAVDDEVHVVPVPEAPGMVCFVDGARHPFHCAPLWVVLDAQYRLPAHQ
jgi:hypothetical protein